jgi:chaperonin GroEL
MRKYNLSDENIVREKIYNGVSKMNAIVSKTLGPNGRSILIERGMGEPLIVDDGRRAAENIKLDDEIEQLAVRVCYGVTRKTDEKVGDGTTTSMVLTHAILKEVAESRIPFHQGMAGTVADVGDVDREIHKARDEVLAKLDAMAKQIKTEKQLIDVATVSVGDVTLGEIVGKSLFQLGKDGHITLEFDLLSEKISHEVVPGLRFTGGYAARWMITDEVRKNCVMDDVPVLVTERKDIDVEMVQPIVAQLVNNNQRKLCIIAPRFTDAFLKTVYYTATKQKFAVICVRAPGRGYEALKDIAIFTGATFYSKEDDIKLANKQNLGHVQHLEVDEDTTILVEGAGDAKDVKSRIEEVKAEVNQQHLAQFKNDRLERASALAGGVAVIRIGAPTDEDRNFIKEKLQDAKYATKIAFNSGVVQGGGMAFKKIAEELPEGHIFKNVLMAPYETLSANASGKFSVPTNVMDPVEVEKAALTIACSAASKLIRIGGAIAIRQPSSFEESLKTLNKSAVQDDAEWEE